MGNHLCSICSKQTNITEIKQLSLNLINHNKNKINNRNIQIIDSSSAISKSYSCSNLSLNQEINHSKQSLYDFNNLIFLVNEATKNIISNHIQKNTKIEEEIKDLVFINTYKDYKTLKNDEIYPIKDTNFEKIGIPKEIYQDKGLNYIQRKNYLEVLFIKEMKMVKVFNNLENKDSDNLAIINHINNFNNIRSFSKKIHYRSNSLINYSLNKEKNEKLKSDNNSNSKSIDISNTEIETNNHSPANLIFKILLLISIEEKKIISRLKNKLDIKIVFEYHLINNDWLEKYKIAYYYYKINNILEDYKKTKLTKNDILNIIKNNPEILGDISDTFKDEKISSELKDINKLIFNEYNKTYKDNDSLNKINIPYNFSLITPKILELILKQNDFKCENNKEKNCICPFCEGNFLKKYKCYIGNETIFIWDNDNIKEYFASDIDIDKYKSNQFKMNYLFLFENNDKFIDEIEKNFCNANNISDYFKKRNINRGILKQDIVNMDNLMIVGKIININLLLVQKKKIMSRNLSAKIFNKYEEISILKSKTFKKNLPKKSIIKFEPLLSYKKPALIGLNKSGHPYFFNSIFQCLSNIPELTNYFLFNYQFFTDEKNKTKYPFCYYYSSLMAELWKRPSEEDSEINNYPYYKKSFLPFQIKEYLFNINNIVLIDQKNEFREFFLYIIKLIDTELNIADKENLNDNNNDEIKSINSGINKGTNSTEDEEKLLKKFREDYHNKFNSIIQQNFYSEIQVCYQCLECNLFKYHYEIVNSFTFDFEIIKQNYLLKYKFKEIMNKVLVFSLDDCFENQEKPSILEQNIICQKCKLKTLQKQIRIIKAPNILVLFFKEKDISKIQFKISLDFQLNPYIHELYENISQSGNNLQFKRNSYDLICILFSPTSKAKKGQYLAYCKNPVNNWWYCFNDSIVNSVDEQALREIKIPKLLIYKKKEIINLIFVIDKEQKYDLEVDSDMVFRNVVSYLYVKYSWMKKLDIFYFTYNDKKIDLNKKVSQNNLSNGSIIICKRGIFI